MSVSALHPAAASPPLRLTSVVHVLFAALIFCGMISLIEPSPYDFLSIPTILLFLFSGVRVHRAVLPIIGLWIVFEIAGFAALMPYWDQHDPRTYQLQSLYLVVTTIFFTLFFSDNTLARTSLCLKAYTAGAFVSALLGFIGYLNIAGLGAALTTYEGRVSGSFKDPNVFGSYLILSATYLLHRTLIGGQRHPFLALVALLLQIVGIFVSFSRGSWGGALFAFTLMTISVYATAEHRNLRIRITRMVLLTLVAGAIVFGGLLSMKNVRTFFLQRAALTQDYDRGVTGRFGNQIRSIPMLLERPEGFGPLRFRVYFDLEPHNSYIGGFANDGWLGGFTWLGIVATSAFVGLRLMFKPSPYRRTAQVFVPALLALLAQGFQIDVDHWRELFLLFGAVWGMEAARQRWRRRAGPADRVTNGREAGVTA